MAGHSKWANIKHRKAAQDAKRGKIFTRLIREIVISAKLGGGDPSDNPRLRAAIDKALDANMTKDTIERAVKRGAGGDEEGNLDELTYEGYAPGGVAVLDSHGVRVEDPGGTEADSGWGRSGLPAHRLHQLPNLRENVIVALLRFGGHAEAAHSFRRFRRGQDHTLDLGASQINTPYSSGHGSAPKMLIRSTPISSRFSLRFPRRARFLVDGRRFLDDAHFPPVPGAEAQVEDEAGDDDVSAQE